VYKQLYDKLEKATSHNGSYKEYRELLLNATPPKVPYLGTSLLLKSIPFKILDLSLLDLFLNLKI